MKISSLFSVVFAIFILLLALILMIVLAMISNQSNLIESEEIRYKSYLLADELRQTSDDLTKYARAFSLSGDKVYEEIYNKILSIRAGKSPRSKNSHRIYWDFYLVGQKKPTKEDKKISLSELMKKTGFTKAEMAKLTEAEELSNKLALIEMQAMNAAKGLFKDVDGNYTLKAPPDFNLAKNLVYSKDYDIYKAKIMQPIDDFFEMVETRTFKDVESKILRSNFYFAAIIVIFIFTIIFSFISLFILNKRLTMLQSLQNGLKSFFDFLNSKSDSCIPVAISTNDEIGTMANYVNENIKTLEKSVIDDRHFLKHATEALHKLASGNFAVRLQYESDSTSMQDLKDTINKMADLLQANVRDILEILTQYTFYDYRNKIDTSNLQADLYEMATGVSNLGESISKMLQESLREGESLLYTVSEVKTRLDSLSASTIEQAAQLQQTSASVEDFSNFIKQTSDKTLEVEKKSEDIKSIVEIINNIAEQTNLLALNAAIEAARAGEHGRGFAVVADEVRQLAENTQQNLSEINKSINDLIDSIERIGEETSHQARSIEEINQAIIEIDKATNTNAQTATYISDMANKVEAISKGILQEVKTKKF